MDALYKLMRYLLWPRHFLIVLQENKLQRFVHIKSKPNRNTLTSLYATHHPSKCPIDTPTKSNTATKLVTRVAFDNFSAHQGATCKGRRVVPGAFFGPHPLPHVIASHFRLRTAGVVASLRRPKQQILLELEADKANKWPCIEEAQQGHKRTFQWPVSASEDVRGNPM